MKPSEDGWFEITVEVSISPVFFAWVFQFGELARINGPDSLIEEMQGLLKGNMQHYS